jgi:alpha-glucosidase (family GH31 glycosyl hydrolase)
VDNSVKFKLPYTPTGRDLEEKSMPLDTFSVDQSKQLDTHNLFGTQEVMATDAWFAMQNKRTFILTRSSYSGIGKFSSKWLGDNFSSN